MKSFIASIFTACFITLSGPVFATVRVVTTIPDFGSIAKTIGGDRVSVTALVKPTQDPHFVDAKPSLVLALNRADLLLTAGMELEAGWLPPLVSGARNRDILPGAKGHLECASLIVPMEVRSVNRAEGDIHPGGNPHYWTDPRNGVRLAIGIADKLKALDPTHAAQYDAGRDRFVEALKSAMARWRKALTPLKGTKVVVYHESWVYFLEWSGLTQAGALEPKPGIPPTPSHVASLISAVSGQNVRFMMQESFYPTQLSRLFAAKSGAALKVLPTMTGAAGTHSYIDLIDTIVKELLK